MHFENTIYFLSHCMSYGVNKKERRKPQILKKKNPSDAEGHSDPKEATVVLKFPVTFGLCRRRGSVMRYVI